MVKVKIEIQGFLIATNYAPLETSFSQINMKVAQEPSNLLIFFLKIGQTESVSHIFKCFVVTIRLDESLLIPQLGNALVKTATE